jgi:hypothetical protein
MKAHLSKVAGLTVIYLGLVTQANAWNGPICYPDTEQQITLTLETYAGEKPGELQVQFHDNDDELKLLSVRPSGNRPESHEVVLRHPEGEPGIVGVKLFSPLSREKDGPTYEFEFRKKGEGCNGASIEAQVTTGAALSSAINDFNQRLQKEKPWGAYILTEEAVKQSIIEQMNKIDAEYRDDFGVVLAGRLPGYARLVYSSANEKHFFVRLNVSRGSYGYSLRVGKDVLK